MKHLAMPLATAARPATPRRRMLQLGAGLALATVLPPLAARPDAAPTARLRLSLERDARRLEVGDAIIVRLEVWVSTWFQGAVDFPTTLAVEGALVEVIGGSPDSRFEELGGRRWTGLIRRYRVLPVQPGEVSVALPGPLLVPAGGGSGRALRLAPPAPRRLTVRVPKGAEDIQPFVAARRLELRQRWWPEITSDAVPLQVGDLVRREIVLVTDSSSPLLPAPDFGAPAGALVRVQGAESQEKRAHAAATATLTRRHEAVYSLQRAGEVVVPPIEMVWWDLSRRRRRVTRLEGRSFGVQPAAARSDPFAVAAPEATPPASGRGTATDTGRNILVALLAGGALIAGAAALRWHGVRGRAAGAAPLPRTEAQIWRQLKRACRRGDAPAADAALRDALALLHPDTRQRWLLDPQLATASAELGRRRFGPEVTDNTTPPPQVAWRGEALWQVLRRLRQEVLQPANASSLPALYP